MLQVVANYLLTALRDNRRRITSLVLLGATGIKPEPPLEIAGPAKLGPVKTGELAFYRPELRLDPTTLSEAQKAAMAENQRVLRENRTGLSRPRTSVP